MYPGNGEERGGEQIALHLFPVEELERQAARLVMQGAILYVYKCRMPRLL